MPPLVRVGVSFYHPVFLHSHLRHKPGIPYLPLSPLFSGVREPAPGKPLPFATLGGGFPVRGHSRRFMPRPKPQCVARRVNLTRSRCRGLLLRECEAAPRPPGVGNNPQAPGSRLVNLRLWSLSRSLLPLPLLSAPVVPPLASVVPPSLPSSLPSLRSLHPHQPSPSLPPPLAEPCPRERD